MSYNGRAVMAEVAARHGWSVSVPEHGAHGPGGETLVTYERFGAQVIIIWTAENTAKYIAKNYGNEDQVIAHGPLGLVKAREWIEEPV